MRMRKQKRVRSSDFTADSVFGRAYVLPAVFVTGTTASPETSNMRMSKVRTCTFLSVIHMLRCQQLSTKPQLVTRLGNDALRSQNLPRPVILLLGSIIADDSVPVVLSIPEHAAVKVRSVNL